MVCNRCGKELIHDTRGRPKKYCTECKSKKEAEWVVNSYLKRKKYYLKQQNDYRKLDRYKKRLNQSRQLLNRANSIIFLND
jgi:hypothetical protein